VTRCGPTVPGWPADEILNSLADYLAKLGPGSPANRQD
jgi:hypothetical protein